MRQGFLFLIPALALAAGGIALENLPARVLLWWAAGSLFLVAMGYFGLGGRVFGKRPDGTVSTIAVMIFAPYLVLALIIAAICRWSLREAVCHQISERMYVGRRLLGRECRILEKRKIRAVLDLTAATPEPRAVREGRSYRSLPLLDGSAPSLKTLADEVGWLLEQSKAGPVYVHCAAGHGRAALLGGAYLLATGEVSSADEAIARQQQVRPHVRLNRVQRRRLAEYAASISSGQ
jgi:hypothetical protein